MPYETEPTMTPGDVFAPENRILSEEEQVAKLIERLPQPYKPVTEEFLEAHRDAIADLKAHFEKRKIRLFRVIVGRDEKYAMICRVPSRQIAEAITDKIRKKSLNGVDAGFEFARKCLVYPSVDELYRWVDEEHVIGVPAAIGEECLKQVRLVTESRSGEL